MIKVGDFVSRESYDNDLIFEVIEIIDEKAIISGKSMRLIADAPLSDLNLVSEDDLARDEENDEKIIRTFTEGVYRKKSNRFLPGKILQIDGDRKYLQRCLNFYKELGIYAIGVNIRESEMPKRIMNYIKMLQPEIIVITGHDSYNKKGQADLNNYKNSTNYIKTVKKVREYHPSLNEIIIIAGACQSHYEAILGAGANYASAPRRVNIHALDPAILAAKCSTTPFYDIIQIEEAIDKTSNRNAGMGGIQSFGSLRKLTN